MNFPGGEQKLGWDLDEDVHYSHHADAFDKVLHVFKKQSPGVRAAAGSLPGHKLAIDDTKVLSLPDFAAFVDQIQSWGIKRYVFHDFTRNHQGLIQALSRVGLSNQVHVVLHANMAQWDFQPLRQRVFYALDLVRRGAIRRLHTMKRGHQISDRDFKPLLLNMSPRIEECTSEAENPYDVFLPGTSGLRKNLHCNAFGAALLPEIRRIVHYSRELELPPPHSAKLFQRNFIDRQGTFANMSQSRATLSVSLVECHPMVNLESEAVGRPCLRNDLRLDAGEGHPYVKLVQVDDPTDPAGISITLGRVLSVPELEIRSLIRDYRNEMNRISLMRYAEFLGL